MAEKNGGERLYDLETGNTKGGSSSMNTEITKVSASTPNDTPPTSVKKENTTTPNENSKSEGGAGEGMSESATPTRSKSSEYCSVILLVVIGFIALLVAPVYYLIAIVYFIVTPKKWTIWVVLEWIALVGFTGFLVASLTKHNLKNHLIWELELWKWCILLMFVVCGKLISEWIVNAIFLLIQLLFADNLKVYCFAYGLKQKNRVFVWWGLVLIAWLVLVIWLGNRGGTRSEETKKILDYVTRALGSFTIGAFLWLGKDLLLWSFAISFHSKIFFERILKAKFYKFVIETLDHPSPRSVRERLMGTYGIFNWAEEIKKGGKSVGSIKLFIDGISDDSNYKPKPELENGKEDQGKENEAQPPATRILGKVQERKRELDDAQAAQSSDPKNAGNRLKNAGQDFLESVANLISTGKEKGGKAGPSQSSYPGSGEDSTITKEVISSFFKTDESLSFPTGASTKDEVDMLFQLIGQTSQREKPVKGSDSVGREEFNNWIGNVYQEFGSLESSLHSTRRGMEELNKLAKGIVLVLILIVWLLMMKVLSTQAVALILSQFFVLTFVFGDSCKRIFEGIIFVFVTHPFDIDDRCLIEDREEEVFVKEINIQTTVFSRVNPIDHKDDDNMERIVYPNSVLATKHICNFHKIPKLDMTDSVEFVVDASTSIEQIEAALNSRLRDEVRSPWIKEVSVRANGSEHGDKIKMGVHVTYNYFWKDNVEKNEWKSQIVLRLKQILDMTDSVEFVVDASTSTEQIDTLNSRLKEHIKEKGPSIKDISVHANGFEDGGKIKMGVYVTYKNFWKDNQEKSAWKSKIVLGLKQILEDMGISKYAKKIN